ncbi:hypothetical protein DL766_006299 [Monosporascus sp. MC13-8B]|uniref:Uncharacterized protein n=1 Tax=Monosporascus cannonballus TaxID=155416 RepID=A0ABY0H724_9PEZI|nr:hypothetical protein DL762_004673 [Monosporascus cannonballus]RYO98506.1 hypothetical protein DL763_002158 [Monosporascus cannonballus]RYP27626.1 hypothetical protein DL766_006299 [Monosporascus sp. MC13-8B]
MGNCFSAAAQPTKREKPGGGGKKRHTGSEGGSARQPAPNGVRSPEGHHQRTPKRASGKMATRGRKRSQKKSGGQPERSRRHSENPRQDRERRARVPPEPSPPVGAQGDVPLRLLEVPRADVRRDGRSPPRAPSVRPVPAPAPASVSETEEA